VVAVILSLVRDWIHRAMKRRTKLITIICIVAMGVGVLALSQGLRGVLYPVRLGEERTITGYDEPLTERQWETVTQTDAILKPWRPVHLGLDILQSLQGAFLVVSSIAAFGLHPAGRRLLFLALILTVAMDALLLASFFAMNLATFDINLRHMIGTEEEMTGNASSASGLRTALVLGIGVFGAIKLLKIGLEAAACKYLRSATIRDLYRNAKARASRCDVPRGPNR